MAKREVDLVIRARDEAAKVVDGITSALKTFNEQQQAIAKGSSRTGESLKNLEAAFAKLNQSVKSTQIAEKLASDAARSSEALGRMRQAIVDSSAELAKAKTTFDQASLATEKLQRKTDGAAKALRDAKASFDQAKASNANLVKQLAEATTAQERLIRTQERQVQAISKQEVRLEAASQRYERLRAEVEKTDKPTKTLANSFDAAARALERESNKLVAAREAHAKTASEVQKAAETVNRLQSSLEQSNGRLENHSRRVSKIENNYKALRGQLSAAAQGQKLLGEAVESASRRVAQQTDQLRRGERELQNFAAAAAAARQGETQLVTAGRGAMVTDLANQRRATLEAKREWVQATEAVKQLVQQIGAVGVPTRAMSDALNKAKMTAAALKQEFLAQRLAQEQMRRSVAEVGTTLDSLAAAQQRASQAQAQARERIAALRGELARNIAALQQQSSAAEKAAQAQLRASTATRQASSAAAEQTRQLTALQQAYRLLYGESRQALSLTQRWRGEVLALVSSYAGFFAAINILKQVTDAYMTLEAAQGRLRVVFDSDEFAVNEEMDFLRRNAERLGIELGVLANQYTRFAVAAKGTNLEGEATRRIFISVAEAARVNKASTEQLNGTFLALEQMVSKGAVTMEELRRQLGDRLPGAVQIMADAVGVSVAELTKIIEQGQLSSDYLLNFADELDKRFGAALPAALDTLTTQLGRLQNAAFQALLAFGEAGFIEAFTELLADLVDLLKSAEFVTFTERMSALAATVVRAISLIIRNFQLFATVAAGLIGLRLTPVFVALAAAMGSVKAQAIAASIGLNIMTASAGAAGAAAAGAAGRVTGLVAALRLLTGATGIGLLVTALTAAFGYWITSASEANDLMIQHREIIDRVKDAYDGASGKVEDWRKNIRNLTTTEVAALLRRQEGQLWNAVRSVERAFTFRSLFPSSVRPVQDALAGLYEQFRQGEMSATELRDATDELFKGFREAGMNVDEFGERIIGLVNEMIRQEEATRELENVLIALSGTTEEAQAALDELTGAAERNQRAMEIAARNGAKAFNDEMTKLRDTIPSATEQMNDFEKSVFGVEAAFQSALSAARALPDAIMRIAAEQEALRVRNEALMAVGENYIQNGLPGSLVDRIIGIESGGNPNARNPNSTATGLGQFIESTWLRMFKQYFPDRAQGMTDAMILALRTDAALSRQMVELYIQENARILNRAGIAITDANLYLAHFLGPGGATSLLRARPGTPVSEVLSAGQIRANQSILGGKTVEEVVAWAERKVGVSNTELQIQERLNQLEGEQARRAEQEAERREEAARRQQEATDQRIADGEFEIQQQRLINDGMERQAVIERAIREARAQNPAITQEEVDLIARQAAQLYDLQQANRERVTDVERAEEAERRINTLLEYRNALEEQAKIAREDGDTEKLAELQVKMAEVNAELQKAIVNAQTMWEAVGGEEADAAIARLETMRLQAARFGVEAAKTFVDWQRVGTLLVDGLTGAFDSFAQSLAEGKNAIDAARDAFLKFASDFLIQIGRMIVQQAILNALTGTPLGNFLSIGAPVAHGGGLVSGSGVVGASTRAVNAAVFAGAQRFHRGGLPGLGPNEVPIIAEKGEEVLSKNDPRNILNGGLTGVGQVMRPLKIVNNVSGKEIAAAMLEDEDGSEVLYNWFRANRNTLTTILGS